MTNLTSPAARIFRGSRSHVVLTLGATVFAGAAVEHSSGLLQNLTGAGTTYVGIALQSGVSGDKIECADNCVVRLTVAKASNWAAGDIGATVYASDGNAFTLTSTSNQAIGKVVEIESGVGTTSAVVWVKSEGISQRSL